MKENERDTLADDVHARLRNRIFSLHYTPGTRLIEEELRTSLAAGRTPVREALLRLEGEGLVSRKRGWVVRSVDASAFRALFEARTALEGFAARLAAARIGEPALRHLRAINDQMRHSGLPPHDLGRLNREFHAGVVTAADNPMFSEMHQRSQFQHLNVKWPAALANSRLEASLAQHANLCDALERRDADAAEKLAREHVEATMVMVAQSLEDGHG